VKIYVINLDGYPERLNWIDAQLSARGLSYERFAAFTPDTIPATIRARFHERALDALLPNNIASFSSHLGVAERLLASQEQACLVLEDDVELLCSAEELRAIAARSGRFDILKLNDWPKSPTLEVDRAGGFRIVRYLQVPRGAGSYFLTRRGAERLLAQAVSLAISTDNFIRAEAYLHLDIAGVVPPPIPQDRFGASSIDPTRLRGKSRNRRYFYGAQSKAGVVTRFARMTRQLGPQNLLRLQIAQIAMKARRIKRDLEGRYVLKGRPAASADSA
jgi:GR25 family glycosyltransferase involved in LPS biosynthesis